MLVSAAVLAGVVVPFPSFAEYFGPVLRIPAVDGQLSLQCKRCSAAADGRPFVRVDSSPVLFSYLRSFTGHDPCPKRSYCASTSSSWSFLHLRWRFQGSSRKSGAASGFWSARLQCSTLSRGFRQLSVVERSCSHQPINGLPSTCGPRTRAPGTNYVTGHRLIPVR